MSALAVRFGRGFRAAVFGAGGGIGSAFVDALTGEAGEVFAVSRSPGASGGIALACDPLNEDDLAHAFAAMGGPVPLVISAVGTLHGEGYGPEKAFRQLEPAAFEQVMRVNALAPAMIAKHAALALPKDAPATIALLSARVGSISDNRLGGWHSYRAAKAALNMLIRGLSVELARTHPQAVVLGLHPGTVDTALSAPFQRGVPDGKLFTPERSVRGMLEVIALSGPEQSGHVYDYAGEQVPA